MKRVVKVTDKQKQKLFEIWAEKRARSLYKTLSREKWIQMEMADLYLCFKNKSIPEIKEEWKETHIKIKETPK